MFPTNLNFSRNVLYPTFREESKSGRSYLVINGVPLAEGVLNGRYVSPTEFGAFAQDWNDIPIVVNHPKYNGGSARVVEPDTPVVGRFYKAAIDNGRLVGEYWLDKGLLESTPEGQSLIQRIMSGEMVENSTGYYSESWPEKGNWNGKPFSFIDKNIHPDHIAILTSEAGACSVADGCGLNRNELEQNGGDGSGHFGHKGRPGEVGGSAASGYMQAVKNLPNAMENPLASKFTAFLSDAGDEVLTQVELTDATKVYGEPTVTFDINTPVASRGKGYGTKAIKDLMSLAKEHGVTLRGYAVPFGEEKGLNKKQLLQWYGRLGFSIRGDEVIYSPKRVIKIKKHEEANMVIVLNMTGNLPAEAKKMWEEIYQKAKKEYGGDEEKAAKTAWAAIKKKYKKEGDKWVTKNEAEDSVFLWLEDFDEDEEEPSPDSVTQNDQSDEDELELLQNFFELVTN